MSRSLARGGRRRLDGAEARTVNGDVRTDQSCSDAPRAPPALARTWRGHASSLAAPCGTAGVRGFGCRRQDRRACQKGRSATPRPCRIFRSDNYRAAWPRVPFTLEIFNGDRSAGTGPVRGVARSCMDSGAFHQLAHCSEEDRLSEHRHSESSDASKSACPSSNRAASATKVGSGRLARIVQTLNSRSDICTLRTRATHRYARLPDR